MTQATDKLAELEAKWLEQVRAVLKYHAEWRRQNKDVRETEQLRKAKERAQKAAERVTALEAKANGGKK